MSKWRPLLAVLALVGSGCSVWPFSATPPRIATSTSELEREQTQPAEQVASPDPTPLSTLPATPGVPNEAHQANALREGFQSELDELQNATRYSIEASVTFEPDTAQALISGLTRIRYTNQTGESLDEIALRLWPNDVQYLSSMTVGTVMVDGSLVEPELAAQETAALVPFPAPLEPDQTTDMAVPFWVQIEGQITSGQPKRFGITNGVLLAPTFYPLVPRIVDGEWELVVPPEGGDTTTSETSFYELSLRVPSQFDLVATGIEIDRQSNNDGTETVRLASGPVRDVAFTLGTFAHFTKDQSGVTLHAWMLPEHEDELETVLEPAASQVAILTDHVGPYPYPELDIIDAPGAFGGIEYPGLIYIGTVGTSWVTEPVVHEVAHQWFYGVIGNDQVAQPWLDEAAATYATSLYYEFAINPGRGTAYLSDFRDLVRDINRAEAPVGGSVGDYVPFGDYGALVYGKGALFFDALRGAMGDRQFFDFLAQVYREYDFEILSANEFQANAEAVCSCGLDDLFNLWVYQGGEAIPR